MLPGIEQADCQAYTKQWATKILCITLLLLLARRVFIPGQYVVLALAAFGHVAYPSRPHGKREIVAACL
jgi:hypothetical protein